MFIFLFIIIHKSVQWFMYLRIKTVTNFFNAMRIADW